MFDDDIILSKTDLENLLKIKVPIKNWKELDSNNLKIHTSKAKYELLHQLDK